MRPCTCINQSVFVMHLVPIMFVYWRSCYMVSNKLPELGTNSVLILSLLSVFHIVNPIIHCLFIGKDVTLLIFFYMWMILFLPHHRISYVSQLCHGKPMSLLWKIWDPWIIFLVSLWHDLLIVSFFFNKSMLKISLSRRVCQIVNPHPHPLTPKVSSESDGVPFEDPTHYLSLAGALHYLMFTRPDISYSIQQICLHMHAPRDIHMT